jgi:5-methylcytosine-specific restriction endonuclease McrA
MPVNRVIKFETIKNDISNYRSIHTQNDWWVWTLQFVLPRRTWYREHYLQSKHWKKIRRDKILQERGVCAYCGECHVMYGGNLHFVDVHHLTYRRIWHERLSDLKLLCRPCHKKEHENE